MGPSPALKWIRHGSGRADVLRSSTGKRTMNEPEQFTFEDFGAQESQGPNPHYKPPIMRWNQVELVADEGTEFGIECDSGGLLSIVIRSAGKDWPHDRKEPTSGRNTIEPGNICYVVTSDERGPAVGHEFMRSSGPQGGCAVCNGEVNQVNSAEV
jgi:hypothetical protein